MGRLDLDRLGNVAIECALGVSPLAFPQLPAITSGVNTASTALLNATQDIPRLGDIAGGVARWI